MNPQNAEDTMHPYLCKGGKETHNWRGPICSDCGVKRYIGTGKVREA